MIFDDLQRIYSLLRRYTSGEESRSDETALLNLIIVICRRSALHRQWIEQVARIEEASFDAVVGSLAASFLGGKNTSGTLRTLLNRYEGASDEQMLLYVQNLTRYLMYRALYRRSAELNPAPKKMRHHLRQIIRNDPRFFCYYEGKKPMWIAFSGPSDLREGKLPWTDPEILRLLYQLSSGAKGKCELMFALFERVTEQKDHRAFIDFAQLVSLMHLIDKEQAEAEIRDSLARKMETPHERLRLTKAVALTKVDCDHELARIEKNGKLNGYSALYSSAIHLMLDDLCQYRDRGRYWQYLNLVRPTVTERSYRRDHRRFDDLARFAKLRLVEILGKME